MFVNTNKIKQVSADHNSNLNIKKLLFFTEIISYNVEMAQFYRMT